MGDEIVPQRNEELSYKKRAVGRERRETEEDAGLLKRKQYRTVKKSRAITEYRGAVRL